MKYKPKIVRYFDSFISESNFWLNPDLDVTKFKYRKSFSSEIITPLDDFLEINILNLFEKSELNRYKTENIMHNTGIDFQIATNYWCFYPHEYEDDCLKQSESFFKNHYTLDEYLIKNLLE